MGAPEHEQPGLHQVHESLRSTLGRLEEDLDLILDGRDGMDPDGLLGRLARETRDLERVVRDLRSTVDELSAVRRVPLAAAVSEALDEVLFGLQRPLVVRCRWASDLPPIVVAGPPLQAALRRILTLAVRAAAPGGEVLLATSRRDGRAVLTVEVGRDGQVADGEPSALSFRSLDEFVRELGGAFELTDGADGLSVQVEFAIGVEAS